MIDGKYYVHVEKLVYWDITAPASVQVVLKMTANNPVVSSFNYVEG